MKGLGNHSILGMLNNGHVMGQDSTLFWKEEGSKKRKAFYFPLPSLYHLHFVTSHIESHQVLHRNMIETAPGHPSSHSSRKSLQKFEKVLETTPNN